MPTIAMLQPLRMMIKVAQYARNWLLQSCKHCDGGHKTHPAVLPKNKTRRAAPSKVIPP
jgi:hypothetical protein